MSNSSYVPLNSDKFEADEVFIGQETNGEKKFKLKTGLLAKNETGTWGKSRLFVTLTNLANTSQPLQSSFEELSTPRQLAASSYVA